MTVMRETERAKLLMHNGIEFWIQKRWQKADGTLTPAGKKAMAIAASEKRRHGDFDATKKFNEVKRTASAVLLSCYVKIPNVVVYDLDQFWVPLSMVCDYKFVKKKVEEVENKYPFIGTKVIWE